MFQQLRDTRQAQDFWIDAICIDQANEKERPEQVKVMKQIYEKAEAVVIWLAGDEGLERGSARTSKALDTLVKKAEYMEYFKNIEEGPSCACKIRANVLDTLRELVAADDTLLPWLQCVFQNV